MTLPTSHNTVAPCASQLRHFDSASSPWVPRRTAPVEEAMIESFAIMGFKTSLVPKYKPILYIIYVSLSICLSVYLSIYLSIYLYEGERLKRIEKTS